jgi:hypothetical protein
MDAHARGTSRDIGHADQAGRDIGTTRTGTTVYATNLVLATLWS